MLRLRAGVDFRWRTIASSRRGFYQNACQGGKGFRVFGFWILGLASGSASGLFAMASQPSIGHKATAGPRLQRAGRASQMPHAVAGVFP